MRHTALLFVLAASVITAVSPVSAQTSDGSTFFVNAGITSTNLFGGSTDGDAIHLPPCPYGCDFLTPPPTASSDLNVLNSKSFDLGFGIRLTENFAGEITWVRRFREEGDMLWGLSRGDMLLSSVPDELPYSRYGTTLRSFLFGARYIHPASETVDVYGGGSFGRYNLILDVMFLPDLSSELASGTGNAFRLKGGILWEFARRTHLGFELQRNSYDGGEYTETAVGGNIGFSF